MLGDTSPAGEGSPDGRQNHVAAPEPEGDEGEERIDDAEDEDQEKRLQALPCDRDGQGALQEAGPSPYPHQEERQAQEAPAVVRHPQPRRDQEGEAAHALREEGIEDLDAGAERAERECRP